MERECNSKQQKMVASIRNCLVKWTLRLFYPLSVVMTMVQTYQRFRGSSDDR